MITHTIFDVDGLLLDSERVYTQIADEILSKYGKKTEYHIKRKVMGRKPLEAAAILVKEYDLPIEADTWNKMTREKSTPERWHAVDDLPGARRLVMHLANHKVPIAIATGSECDSLMHKMKNHKDMWNCFNHFVASGTDALVKRGKPHPDIFIEAAARFANPPNDPLDVLVFEDAPNGVEAALKAGMRVVWVPVQDESVDGFLDSFSSDLADRVTLLNSLTEFKPELFELPAFE